MKKVIAIVAAVVAAASIATQRPNYYAMTAIVVDLDTANDIVTVEDANGFLWDFYGVEDYERGDLVSCVMDGKHTENILDDKIVNARYSGYAFR